MLAPLVSVLLTAASSPLATKLVTTPWHTTNVDAGVAAFFLEATAKALRAEGVSVVTADDIAAVLGLERERQLLGCSEVSCLAELGNALGCDGIVVAAVARLDGSLHGSLRVVSSRDGQVLTETDLTSSSERGFLDEIKVAAGRVARGLRVHQKVTEASKSSTPAVLALGIAGGALLIGGGVSVALAHVASARVDQELARSGQVTSVAQRFSNEGKIEQTVGWVGVGVGGACLAASLVVALVAGAGSGPSVGVSVTPSGAALSIQGALP